MGFADVIDGVAPTQAYAFGLQAVAPRNSTAIRNQTDLALHFKAFEDFTGHTAINSEIERYQDFNAVNHAFASDRLNLVGALASGMSWNGFVSAPTGVDLSGNANPIANLGLASTAGLRVGQLAAVQYQGIYFINALVTDTSVSLQALGGSPTSYQYNQLIVWLPIDSALLTAAPGGGQPVLSFATAPAGCVVGAGVAFVTGTAVAARGADYRVAAVSGTTATLGQPLNDAPGVGSRVLFMPPVTSGQIWSRDQFSLAGASTFFAVEFDVDVMGGSSDYPIRGINTGSAYAASPAGVPWGAWPALWLYSADDGLSETRDWSEIDVMEMWWSATNGPFMYAGTNHGPAEGSLVFSKLDAGWTGDSYFNVSPTPLVGSHKFQLVYSNGMTWRYIDGVLVKASTYTWTSGAPVQIGINLAIGSLQPSLASNLTVPIQTSNFAGQALGVNGLRIWKA